MPESRWAQQTTPTDQPPVAVALGVILGCRQAGDKRTQVHILAVQKQTRVIYPAVQAERATTMPSARARGFSHRHPGAPRPTTPRPPWHRL